MIHLEHGTEDEHIATLQRARTAGVARIWSGDIGRSAYLRENLAFAEERGCLKLTPYDDAAAQESGWDIQWLQAAPEKLKCPECGSDQVTPCAVDGNPNGFMCVPCGWFGPHPMTSGMHTDAGAGGAADA